MPITPLTPLELNQLIEEQIREPMPKQRDEPDVVIWRAPSFWICDCYCGSPGRSVSRGSSSRGSSKDEAICWLVIACIVLIVSTFVALKQTIDEGSVANKQGNKIRQVEVTPMNEALKTPLLFLVKDHFNCSVVRTTSWGIATVGFAFLTAATLFAIYMHSTRGNHFISESLTRGCFITGGSSVLLALFLRGGHEIVRAGEKGTREDKRAELSRLYHASKVPVQPVVVGVPAGPQVVRGVAVAQPYIIPPGSDNGYRPPKTVDDFTPSAPPLNPQPSAPPEEPPPPYAPPSKEL